MTIRLFFPTRLKFLAVSNKFWIFNVQSVLVVSVKLFLFCLNIFTDKSSNVMLSALQYYNVTRKWIWSISVVFCSHLRLDFQITLHCIVWGGIYSVFWHNVWFLTYQDFNSMFRIWILVCRFVYWRVQRQGKSGHVCLFLHRSSALRIKFSDDQYRWKNVNKSNYFTLFYFTTKHVKKNDCFTRHSLISDPWPIRF